MFLRITRLGLLCLFVANPYSPGPARPQSRTRVVPRAAPVEAPPIMAQFLQAVGSEPSAEEYYSHAKEALWDVYPQDDSLKKSLVEYIATAPDGPALGFAGLALIPFHDPKTVKPLLDRAMDRNVSAATRFSFLNTAPYILSMGDAMYMGEGNIDRETLNFAKDFTIFSTRYFKSGIGHSHALELRNIYNEEKKRPNRNPDIGLILWHQSAYLLGTLDLRDKALLGVFLDPNHHRVFKNVMFALCFASNHDFLASLREKDEKEITPELEQSAARAALVWWVAYLRDHPTGDWLDAVVSGFNESGFKIENDLRSQTTTEELMKAMNATNDITRYNAYRLLNKAYGTHFDLERVFLSDKYALSFLDPSGESEKNEQRLRVYWQKRLSGS